MENAIEPRTIELAPGDELIIRSPNTISPGMRKYLEEVRAKLLPEVKIMLIENWVKPKADTPLLDGLESDAD